MIGENNVVWEKSGGLESKRNNEHFVGTENDATGKPDIGIQIAAHKIIATVLIFVQTQPMVWSKLDEE